MNQLNCSLLVATQMLSNTHSKIISSTLFKEKISFRHYKTFDALLYSVEHLQVKYGVIITNEKLDIFLKKESIRFALFDITNIYTVFNSFTIWSKDVCDIYNLETLYLTIDAQRYCYSYLMKIQPSVKIHTINNDVKSIQKISKSMEYGAAIIAPNNVLQHSNLLRISSNIQDPNYSQTHFIVIKKRDN